MPFNNQFYNEGVPGFIDWVWIWWNRISVTLSFIILILILIGAITGKQIVKPRDQQGESFVSRQNFRNLNRSRQQIKRLI